MEKLYYTIAEVAQMLEESPSLVRFWSNKYPRYVKPRRTAHGNRCYTAEDIAALREIHHLIRDLGMTHEGAMAKMAADRRTVAGKVQALERLKAVREQLQEIKSSL